MRLRNPIFINGMSRGGTTILMNLLGSHPEVAMVGETHKVFKGCSHNDSYLRVAYKCLFRELPVLSSTRQDFFSPRRDELRPILTPKLRRHIDRCLYAEQLRRHPSLNQMKSPNCQYTRDELTEARALGKNLDGAIYLSDVFADMYPDATFVSLVRHGLAVCEGHVRRGGSATAIGRRYAQFVTKLLDDAEQRANHILVRFEQMLADARSVMIDCCQTAGLDIWQLQDIRQQRRKTLQANGEHAAAGKEWEVVWTPLADVSSTLDQGIDQRQISRLAAKDWLEFLREAGDVMDRLGSETAMGAADESQRAA